MYHAQPRPDDYVGLLAGLALAVLIQEHPSRSAAGMHLPQHARRLRHTRSWLGCKPITPIRLQTSILQGCKDVSLRVVSACQRDARYPAVLNSCSSYSTLLPGFLSVVPVCHSGDVASSDRRCVRALERVREGGQSRVAKLLFLDGLHLSSASQASS